MIFNSFDELISSINDYDKSGLFSIGFKMFLLGFALVFLAIFGSNLKLKDDYCLPSQTSDVTRILIIIGSVIAISGLITSIASVYITKI